ncbi:translation initiation factor IF-2 [Clostridium fessum]|uniref:translation initiation factor IF-2 n=8 Tax=Clostridium TaxID=1485 RepID=UPI0022E98259|nr:translation initiation factor IF-2 [Clostridium fessum]
MRVNELSKQIGKSNKEVLEILQKNHFDVKSHSSKVTEEQAEAVRCFLAGAKRQTTASKTDTGKAETNRVEDIKKEPLEAEKKEAEKTTEPPKKRIAAVYRPQNSVQRGSRPAGKANTGNAAKTGAPASRPAAASAEQTAEPAKSAAPAENRDGQRSGYQGNRDGQRSGGYQGNRDGQRSGGYQGNRDGQRSGGYQGNRDGQRSGGYQGNRDGQRSGYQGNRDGQRNGGYQGNRDGQRSGGYQGSRDGQRSGGYQGSRDGQRSGGYQGNRDGQRSGGYQGNRDGQRSGGYQGNRDGQRSGGYQGGRDGQRGGRDGRGGLNIPKPSFDSPVVQKPQNNKQNKNNYKNDKYSKIDHEEEMHSKGRGGKNVKSAVQPPQKKEAKVEEIKTITIPEVITIKDLADKMKLQPSVIVKKLFLQGKVVTINQEVDYEQAEEIAMEFDVLCEKEVKVDVIEELLKEEEEDEKDMVTRPPVVCVMGHVDHGKTSLLDAIRQTNVTAKEAGGITQHIGAYMVEINGQKITFLDTPGHEAFTAMRMRGAKSTDIAILVVAADDGVMPQTIEAINHAKAAGVEIIVAINKIDKPSANIEKVKQELIEYELVPEDWGGSTIFVPVSAHTKEGIKELLEMILLTAEVKELKANPNRNARGLVIEAELDKGKGPVATVLVQKGTLHVGDPIAAGACYGRVRAMMDDKGRRVKEAGPSTPVEILGLNDVPNAGEVFVQPENEKEARSFAETFISESKNKLIEDTKMKLSLDDLFSQIKAGNVKELPLIVKADVQGSVEAVKQSLMKLSNEEVVVKVIHGGVGAINESDVSLAAASNAIIIGFNVRPDATAKSIAEREKVDVRLYRVIYQAIEDVEAAMKGMLDPIYEEQVIGHAVVRQTFKASGVGTIAGSYVLDGKFQRGCKARITRDGEQIFDGPLASLKRFKDDVKEVASGYECGLVFEKFNDLQEDDMIEAYAMVEVPR